MYKIIRSGNLADPFDEGTLDEMKEGLTGVSILMNHLNFPSYFNDNKESLFVTGSRKHPIEYRIVED